eukprot:scaffold9153_cov121-Cylindrotheca_fusiformis.AAC.14
MHVIINVDAAIDCKKWQRAKGAKAVRPKNLLILGESKRKRSRTGTRTDSVCTMSVTMGKQPNRGAPAILIVQNTCR